MNDVNEIDAKIRSFMEGLGLTNQESLLFNTLLRSGPQTTLNLAKLTKINRTTVYRLLESLKNHGAVEEIVDAYRKMAKAADLNQIELLLSEKETKLKYLRNLFPYVTSFFSNQGNTVSHPDTKVLYYRGKEGILRQVWNTLRAEKELVGYTYRPLNELIGDYYLKWREEWINRKLILRDIYSDEYLKSRKSHNEDSLTHPENCFSSHYIPSTILNINHQVDIYNNVVSYYNWFEGEIFGVEIYNDKIAAMQKQIFELVWEKAEEYSEIS